MRFKKITKPVKQNLKCKKCSEGVLKPTQWNMIVCNKCTYKELL